MAHHFLEDPDEYVDPARYLDQIQASGQPSVLLLYRLPDGRTGWADVIPPSWQPIIRLENALQLADTAELADALFLPGDKSLQIEGRHTLRKELGLEPVRLIQLATKDALWQRAIHGRADRMRNRRSR